MLGADTFVSALLRIVSTVAVLAAVYFFIVKPILHTTENVTKSVNHSVNSSFNNGNREAHRAIRQAERAVRRAGLQAHHSIKVQIHKAVKGTPNIGALPKDAQRILRCIDRAHGDVNKIQACNQP